MIHKEGYYCFDDFRNIDIGGAYFIGVFGRLFVTLDEIGGDLDRIVPTMLEKALRII